MIVVDANVIVHALVAGPEQELARQVAARDPDWRAPRLWRSEVWNALTLEMRARGLELERVIELAEAAELLVAEAEDLAAAAVIAVAAESGLTAYDSEYVALAFSLGGRLVTNDRRLLRAFPETAVSMSGFAAGK